MNTTPDEITNSEDVIDSRDIIARIEYLENEAECYADEYTLPELDLTEAYQGAEYEHFFHGMSETEIEEKCNAWQDWEYYEEYKALKALADECDGYGDWAYGEALINEDYWVEYCEELCKDIGELPRELPWYIANHIDWKGVAGELEADYMQVEFDGKTYYMRA